jgi:UPF0755 protein
MKRLLFLFFLLLLLAAAGLVLGFLGLQRWGDSPRHLSAAAEVTLEAGESLKNFSQELAHAGVVEHPLLFQLWTRLFSRYERFQAGRYLVPAEYSIRGLVQDVQSGNVYNPVVLQFTIPEGFTISKIADRLAALGVGSREEVLSVSTDPAFIAQHGVTAQSLEGYLYPATYQFTEFPDVRTALATMIEVFWKKVPPTYEQDVSEKGLSLHEAITFASLIELETHHDSERSMVSEVIWNRLQRNIALAIDASIIYGIDDYEGDLKRVHLDDAGNLYNTRKHRGLPPGPIGSPSIKSLEAVLTPSANGYFYYVLDLETGLHNFSKSLKEHNGFVQKMLRDRRKIRAQAVPDSKNQ